MAEFWSNSDRGYRLRLWIDQVSQDVEQNTSQVELDCPCITNGTRSQNITVMRMWSLTVKSKSGRADQLCYNLTP